MLDGAHAGGLGPANLVGHVDVAGRVVADQHDGEAGGDAMGGLQAGDGLGDLGVEGGGAALAVDDRGAHGMLRSVG